MHDSPKNPLFKKEFVTLTGYDWRGKPHEFTLSPWEMLQEIEDLAFNRGEEFGWTDVEIENLRSRHEENHDESDSECETGLCELLELIESLEERAGPAVWYHQDRRYRELAPDTFDFDDDETYSLERLHELAALWGQAADYGRVYIEIPGDNRFGISTPSKQYIQSAPPQSARERLAARRLVKSVGDLS